MAYRISATTDRDKALLEAVREHAWISRQQVSTIIREALLTKLYGKKSLWPDEYQR